MIEVVRLAFLRGLCVGVRELGLLTRTSAPTVRTAPNSPSLPDVIVHPAGICSHSATSQYFPMRFHTSAAGRLTVISIGIGVGGLGHDNRATRAGRRRLSIASAY